MDLPVLTAVIGVGGSLMGTIVGGCLTMYANFFLNNRRERAEFRIGCLLIAQELEQNHTLLTAEVELKGGGPMMQEHSQRKPGKSTDTPRLLSTRGGLACCTVGDTGSFTPVLSAIAAKR